MNKQVKFYASLIICAFTVAIVNAQTPSIEWQKSYGGASNDLGASIIQTEDGGYAIAGFTTVDTTVSYGTDFWVAKLKEDGTVSWEKSLGGSDAEGAYSIASTFDRGFIIAGNSSSNDGDVTGNHGGFDIWTVKLDSTGNIQWQKCLGSSHSDYVASVIQTSDSGFVVVGNAEDNSGDVTNNHGGWDYWFARLNKEGILQWENSYGGSDDEEAHSVVQTPDSGFVIAGNSSSSDGDVSINKGDLDYWIVKINSEGIIQWQKSYGGSGSDGANSIKITKDGGFAIAGGSGSNDYDVIGNHAIGIGDVWFIKLDQSGNLLWQKCYGGSEGEEATTLDLTANGGYVMAGPTTSIDGDVSGYHVGYPGYHDYWVIGIDSIGNLLWQKCLGGTADDYPYSLAATDDNVCIITGYSYSTDGDVTNNIGGDDGWVVKLSNETGISETQGEQSSFLFPNPASTTITLSLPSNQNAMLSIFNLLGEKVKEEKVTGKQVTMDVSSLPQGLYLVRMENRVVGKFAKE